MTCPLSRQEKSRGAWRRLLRSALATLLDLWEPGRAHPPPTPTPPTRRRDGRLRRVLCAGERAVDQPSLLAAVTLFLHSAGVDVWGAEPLRTLCLRRFAAAMDAEEPQVSPPAGPPAWSPAGGPAAPLCCRW